MPISNDTIKSRLFNMIRKGPGEVNWVPPALGFGNHLYMWLNAWTRQQGGADSRILFHSSMSFWLDTFPELRRLTVSRKQVRLTDRRFIHSGQTYGVNFTAAELDGFIRKCLLESKVWEDALSRARDCLPANRLVVNVRRGDYYSVPQFFNNYGMNIESYVVKAVSEASAQNEIKGVRVVSDDPEWCRENLAVLREHGPVDFGPRDRTPLGDLTTLAAAETLVLANSTFSYWGGYINNSIRGHGQKNIWAPAFHTRHSNEGMAWQLNPNWNVIDSVPGGWSPPKAIFQAPLED